MLKQAVDSFLGICLQLSSVQLLGPILHNMREVISVLEQFFFFSLFLLFLFDPCQLRNSLFLFFLIFLLKSLLLTPVCVDLIHDFMSLVEKRLDVSKGVILARVNLTMILHIFNLWRFWNANWKVEGLSWGRVLPCREMVHSVGPKSVFTLGSILLHYAHA